jgi:hypothetical protein
MPSSDYVYKIRRISDGLFSSGGTWPLWRINGKVWAHIRFLRAHLTLVGDGLTYVPKEKRAVHRKENLQRAYGGCEIVTYAVTTLEKATEAIR